jgi:DNA-binding response OmpR family regulator
VGSVGEAVERLGQGGIDLVLTDLTSPDSRDFQTLSSVQAAAPNIPIIVLSGLSDESIAVKMVEKGAEDYLVKGRSTAIPSSARCVTRSSVTD